MDPSQSTGMGKLVHTVPVNGVDCLEVEFSLGIKQPTAPNPPPGLKGIGFSFQITATGVYPADHATGPIHRLMKFEMAGQFRAVPGTRDEGLTLNVRDSSTSEEKIKYLR